MTKISDHGAHQRAELRQRNLSSLTWVVVVPTLCALAPLWPQGVSPLGWGIAHAVPQPDWFRALVPMAGLATMVGYMALTGPLPLRDMRPLFPSVAIATCNAVIWVKLVAFDPCYGSHDACADIGGGPLKALVFNADSLALPVSALVGSLFMLGRVRRGTKQVDSGRRSTGGFRPASGSDER